MNDRLATARDLGWEGHLPQSFGLVSTRLRPVGLGRRARLPSTLGKVS